MKQTSQRARLFLRKYGGILLAAVLAGVLALIIGWGLLRVLDQTTPSLPPLTYTADDSLITVCEGEPLRIPVDGVSEGTVNAVIIYQDVTGANGVSLADNLFEPIIRVNGLPREPFSFSLTQVVDLSTIPVEPGKAYLYHRVAAYNCNTGDQRSCQGATGYGVPFVVTA